VGTYNYVNTPPVPGGYNVLEWGGFVIYGGGHLITDVVPYLFGGNVRGSDTPSYVQDGSQPPTK
jgi:hypothetical protein